jgi:hypothetical protein
MTVCDIDKQRGRRSGARTILTRYHRDPISLSPQHFLPANQHPLPIPHFFSHF